MKINLNIDITNLLIWTIITEREKEREREKLGEV